VTALGGGQSARAQRTRQEVARAFDGNLSEAVVKKFAKAYVDKTVTAQEAQRQLHVAMSRLVYVLAQWGTNIAGLRILTMLTTGRSGRTSSVPFSGSSKIPLLWVSGMLVLCYTSPMNTISTLCQYPVAKSHPISH
jgi:hypothetical protein